MDEFGNLEAGTSGPVFPDDTVGEEILETIEGHAFEALCALLWNKQGFHAHRTPKSGGGGQGLHWDALDEDIHVGNLVLGIGDSTVSRQQAA